MKTTIEVMEVFKMFVYLNHLIGGKSSVPFDKKTTNPQAYKCPDGYIPYNDAEDRNDFNNLEFLDNGLVFQKQIEEEKIRIYHSNVSIATITSRFLIDLNSSLDGGQVSISLRLFNELFGGNQKVGFIQRTLTAIGADVVIKVRDKESHTDMKINTTVDVENIFEYNIVAQEREVTFYLDDDLFSISALIYPQFSCVSLLEGSIKSNNVDSNRKIDKLLFKEVDDVFRSEVTHIPLSEWFDELSQDERDKVELKIKKRYEKSQASE